MSVCPPPTHTLKPSPEVMELEVGLWGKQVVRVEPHSDTSALESPDPTGLPGSSHHVRTQHEGGVCSLETTFIRAQPCGT